MYDLIIIGAGPAGLSAALYAARYNLKTLVLTENTGGIAVSAHKICNFPSYKEISGLDLTQKMINQVKDLDVEIKHETINSISKQDGHFIVKGSLEHEAKKVIYAVGTKRKKLNVVGEGKFLSRGVSYCATCDAAFFKDKDVMVVGGGNAALTSAILLSEYANRVYISYRQSSFFRAEQKWVEQIESNPKIESIFESEIKEIKGDKFVEKVELKDGRELYIEGLFVEAGSEPNNSILKDLDVEMEKGYVKTDKGQRTNIEGLYAAGDCTTGSAGFQQIITAASEGAVAAHTAYEEK